MRYAEFEKSLDIREEHMTRQALLAAATQAEHYEPVGRRMWGKDIFGRYTTSIDEVAEYG